MRIFKKGGPPRGGRVVAPGERYSDESGLDTMQDGSGFAGRSSPTAMQVGAILRQAREQQGLTIGDVSRQTRIRDVYLLALEAGEMEKLPGSTFVAGFLRLYAETLELTDRGFIEHYLARSGHDDSLHTELFPAPTTSRHRPSVVMVLGGLIGLLSLFFVYENYFSLLSRSASTPELPITMPRRTDTVPVERGMQNDPVPFDSAAEEGDGQGSEQESFAGGLLSRFFDQPVPHEGLEEEAEQTPLPTATKQVGTTASEPSQRTVKSAVSDKTASESAGNISKKTTHTPESVGAGVATKPTLPVVVKTEHAAQLPQEPENTQLALAHAWLERATTWLGQVIQVGGGEREEVGRDQTEPSPSWPQPVTNSQQTIKPLPAKPPVQPVPVVQSIPQKMSGELQSTAREGSVKPVEPVATARTVVESASPVKPVVPTVSDVRVKPIVPVVPKHAIETGAAAQVASKSVVSTQSATTPAAVAPPAAAAPTTQKGGDPAALIVERYPEKVNSDADLKPESTQAVSLLANELVWVQIQDAEGRILKDMVMQPNQLFRVPVGGQFSALLGNAGAIRVMVGTQKLPYLGASGEEISGVDLTPSALLKRAKP